MKTCMLNEDIAENTRGKNKKVYGLKSEKVSVVSQHDEVLIVQGKSGRFPVRVEKVTQIN